MNVPEPLITLPDVSGVMMAGVFKLEVHPASSTGSPKLEVMRPQSWRDTGVMVLLS